MRFEECYVGMKVVINQEADGFWTLRYRRSLATIEDIHPHDNRVDIYCEDKRVEEEWKFPDDAEYNDGLIRGVHPSFIDRAVSCDSIECDVDEILV